MITMPGYIAAIILPLPGLVVYFLNPNRSISLVAGLFLNLILAALVFYITIPQDLAIDKFKRYAQEDPKENRKWLLGGLGIYIVGGVLILIGIKSSLLRFILFLVMWGGAFAAGEFAGFFVWHRFNKEWLAKEAERKAAEAEAKAAAEAEKRKQQELEAQKLAAQRAAEQEKAEAAAREKAAQEAAAKLICRGCGREKTASECICLQCGYTDTPYGTWQCIVQGYTSTIVLEENGRFVWSIAGVPAAQGYRPGHFSMELEELDKPESLKIFVRYDHGSTVCFHVKSLKQDEMHWENPGPPLDRFYLTRLKRK